MTAGGRVRVRGRGISRVVRGVRVATVVRGRRRGRSRDRDRDRGGGRGKGKVRGTRCSEPDCKTKPSIHPDPYRTLSPESTACTASPMAARLGLELASWLGLGLGGWSSASWGVVGLGLVFMAE